jgi:hypothetical protein
VYVLSPPFNVPRTTNTGQNSNKRERAIRAPLLMKIYLAEEQALLNSVGADRVQKQALFVQKYSSMDPSFLGLAHDLGYAVADLATARGQL